MKVRFSAGFLIGYAAGRLHTELKKAAKATAKHAAEVHLDKKIRQAAARAKEDRGAKKRQDDD